MVSKARRTRADGLSDSFEMFYSSEEEIGRLWESAVNPVKTNRRRRNRTWPPEGVIAKYSEYLCVKGTIGLLLDKEECWSIYARGCELAAFRESIRLFDEVSGTKTGASMDPDAVRLMSALFMLGRLKAARYLIQHVLPITWQQRLNVVETKSFSLDELDLAAESVLDDDPEGQVVGYQLPYSYDLCGLDPMLLMITSRSFGLQIDFPSPPDFCELRDYTPAVDSLQDDTAVVNCLQWMCDDREVDKRTQRDWVVTHPHACFDVPVEILTVMKARELAGLAPIELQHRIVAPPFHEPPTVVPNFSNPLLDRMIEWAHEHRNELASAIFS